MRKNSGRGHLAALQAGLQKYYARYMKGNMSEADFKAWAAQAARDRDRAIEQITPKIDAALKAQIIERLREELNRQ